MNLTAVPKGEITYLATWPAGSTQPLASSLNAHPGGRITANAAIVAAGARGDISVYTSDDTDFIIDVNGYFAPFGANALSLYNLKPCRIIDTRLPIGAPPISGQYDVAITGNACDVPSVAQAFVLNATVVPPGRLDFLRLWAQSQTEPDPSTLNSDGATTSNLALVPTVNGSISARVTDPTHLILDVFGYFAP